MPSPFIKPKPRDEFYDSLIDRQYTASQLMEIHGLSRPTVTKWLKDGGINPIPYSWPYRYTTTVSHVANIVANDVEDEAEPVPKAIKTSKPKVVKPKVDKPIVIKPDSDYAAKYLEHLLTKETRVFDIVDQFRKIKSSEDAQLFIKGLTDVLETAKYYKLLLDEDGLI